ncbi:tRNA epoxyqueuosine(34) reductase QueG [Rhizobium sp. LjRoot254]|uniref:tRNA epoxyqueuosine(34) reductase QueG n=1 Tax=Rhizobium sp. LjRoot254 TaxID=3342297 RepID=UPI003ECE03B4
MPTSISKDPKKLSDYAKALARETGFDICRITTADTDETLGANLSAFVDAGHHGTMAWLEETRERRASPKGLWPEAKSVIMLGMNYGPDHDPREDLQRKNVGNISVYARNRDYHDVIKGKLKEIGGRFAARSGAEIKVFVDTAPVMEKPLAAKAGLGWQGKHTNLLSREFGSWLFLGSIFTDAELTPDAPEVDHCGSCRACLDACPTNAFPAPYQIDARRCISYLTIEHKGQIAAEFRPLIGNRIYGCDDCLAACPWNKFAVAGHEMKLKARADLAAPPLAELLALDDPAFRAFFSGSPVKRIGRNRFIRNCLVAAGNSGDPALIEHCRHLLGDTSPDVRAMAVWALSRLGGLETSRHLLSEETDENVLAELQQAENV